MPDQCVVDAPVGMLVGVEQTPARGLLEVLPGFSSAQVLLDVLLDFEDRDIRSLPGVDCLDPCPVAGFVLAVVVLGHIFIAAVGLVPRPVVPAERELELLEHGSLLR